MQMPESNFCLKCSVSHLFSYCKYMLIRPGITIGPTSLQFSRIALASKIPVKAWTSSSSKSERLKTWAINWHNWVRQVWFYPGYWTVLICSGAFAKKLINTTNAASKNSSNWPWSCISESTKSLKNAHIVSLIYDWLCTSSASTVRPSSIDVWRGS